MTVRQYILMAMKSLGIIASGENATTEEYNDGLIYFQMMLRNFAAIRLVVHTSTVEQLSLVAGTSVYTWGVGGDLNSSRPNKVLYANLNNGDYPIDLIGEKEFVSVSNKSTTGIPTAVYISRSYPLATINVLPVPNAAYTLYLCAVKPFTETSSFSSLDDTVMVAPEYEEPLTNNLAVRISTVFGKAVPAVVASLAASGMSTIMKNNATGMGNPVTLGLPVGEGFYDINKG